MEDWAGSVNMKLDEARVCILRVGGTNCDSETRIAFENSGIKVEVVHFNELVKKNSLLHYDVLVVPGGFSHGDYVRAGAIWGKQLMAKIGKEIRRFVEEERLILGICNGFQVLVEAGLLPQFDGISPFPEAALATNIPSGYNCRWTNIKCERNDGAFTQLVTKTVMRVPVAHAEGRFIFLKEKETTCLERLLDNNQLVFRYSDPSGNYAKGRYPLNPNGSFYDIAGISNPAGTILGLMPHPERAYFGWQLPDWTRDEKIPLFGDGKIIFDSIAAYLRRQT